jgi:hypothetical protein
MKFVKVDKVPNRTRGNNYKLVQRWEEFMSMNVKTVKVEISDDEYKSPKVARTVWITSIKTFGYPIDLKMRGNDIYLVRRDM